MTGGSVTVDVHLDAADVACALLRDAAQGLATRPRSLPPKWFYDERGSALFDDITRLEEYYPTRRELEILRRHAGEVAAACPADTLIELGSGTSAKTTLLLDALEAAGSLARVVPFDVSESTLRTAADTLARAYPGVVVHAVVGDFERHLHLLPTGGRRLVAFLGGTIGNLGPAQRGAFLGRIATGLAPGDGLVLGVDLVKEPDRLVRAYDDAAGVTAAFNRNLLAVLNRELGADFDLDAFAHVACWVPEQEWIEMRLRSLAAQRVSIPAIGMEVDFAGGEELRTEISAKFRRQRLDDELSAAGLRLARWWTDTAGDFAVALAFPA
ncbi:MAG: L-histidine N(alpha)-methyltransferase [Actinobacteria bacterium]|nr:L-histidine N(alpha)-methyltransferase [Actinomycetota bacterium]